MKKMLVGLGLVLTLILSSCTQDVDVISTVSVKDDNKSTVVITKAEDVILKSMAADIDDTDVRKQIQLIFDSESYIVLEVDDAAMIIGNDIDHMVNSEDVDRQSSYDIQVIDKKIFVINEYKNVSSDHEDVDIKCYEFIEGEIVEVWDSNTQLDLTVSENEDKQQMLLVSNKDFNHAVRLDDKVYTKHVKDEDQQKNRFSLGDSTDYRFLDFDGDGHVELLVKGHVNLGNRTIDPFYRVYKISNTIELNNCGFNDDIETEQYFN